MAMEEGVVAVAGMAAATEEGDEVAVEEPAVPAPLAVAVVCPSSPVH